MPAKEAGLRADDQEIIAINQKNVHLGAGGDHRYNTPNNKFVFQY